ncbi:MAG: hypothetical protein ACJAVK_003274, partial [Akkermansiaceae bacterium]
GAWFGVGTLRFLRVLGFGSGRALWREPFLGMEGFHEKMALREVCMTNPEDGEVVTI